MPKFYITTPIYYANDVPHIGHAYTSIAADVQARYHRLVGDDTFFLTGVDEHGAKVEEAARLHDTTPQAYVDAIATHFRQAWRELNISNDDFIRTTEPRHERGVQAFLSKMYERGDIYRGVYEGLYCVGCEKYVTEEDLVDGLCPLHLKPPVLYSEENYFFRLSKYQDTLIRALQDESDPNHYVVEPAARRNEVLGKLGVGLSDISISRASLGWGIPLPFDPDQTTYVWVDALLNYVTAIGYLDDVPKFQHWWPANLQLIAKDILWFHAIIWPAMLISVGLPPPRVVFAHGYFTIGGQKMSKTLGNVLSPRELVDKYGADATRYLMLSEFPFGTDGDISLRSFTARYNANLANDLGNLLNRTLSMINRYCGGLLPAPDGDETAGDRDLQSAARSAFSALDSGIRSLDYLQALDGIWQLVNRANKYVEENAPWALAKSDRQRLGRVLYNLAESLRLVALAIAPFMPSTSARICEQFGIEAEAGRRDFSMAAQWGGLKPGIRVNPKPTPLFPRLDTE